MAVGITVLLFSYLPYVAAFIPPEADTDPVVDIRLVAISMAVAPLVFVSVGLISRNPGTLKRASISMGMLLGFALVVSLVSPVLGAAGGFGAGIAFCLSLPDIEGQMKRRLIGVALAVLYTVLMLFLIPAAGVLAGAVMPALMVGFADEYGVWRSSSVSAG